MRLNILISLLLFALPTWAEDGTRDRQKVAASDVHTIAEAIQNFAEANNKYPDPFGTLTNAGALEPELVPDYVPAVPPVDPWGQPYWYWTNGEHFIVGSGGADSAEQQWRTKLATGPRGPTHALQILCSSPGRTAVLLVDGNFCRLPKDITEAPPAGELTEHDRQVLSARDVRAISTAIMRYWIDNNTYPVLVLGTSGVQSLKPLLENIYVRGLPLVDAWGHPFLYWSNGGNFIVYSSGGNGEDQSYNGLLRDAEDVPTQLASICRGASPRLGADIVFANGEACLWPEGSLED